MNKTIARLLATENIEIISTSFHTAWFDLERRVLGLPNWHNIDPSIADMLICHEVGHALFTPAEGWHESAVKNIDGVPRDYLNVCDDPRQEKLFKRKYPGSIRIFKQAAKKLTELDFFELRKGNKDLRTFSLVDRINIFFKTTENVPFRDEEKHLVEQVKNQETWEDCVAVAKAIYEYDQANKKPIPKEEQRKIFISSEQVSEDYTDDSEESEDNNISTETEDNNTESEESEDNSISIGSEDNNTNTQAESEESTDEESEDEDDEGDDSSGAARDYEYEDGDEDEVISPFTDDLYRSKEKDFATTDVCLVPAITGSVAEMIDAVIPYSRVKKSRVEAERLLAKVNNNNPKSTKQTLNGVTYEFLNDYGSYLEDREKSLIEYKEFMSESKQEVAHLVKSFELKRQAWKNARGTIKPTGKIDPVRLSKYKFTDEIFSNYKITPDGQSHGMIFLIDYSGSMAYVIEDTIKQTLKMTEFCRQAGIPFEVYTFTSKTIEARKNIAEDPIYNSLDNPVLRELAYCSIAEQLNSDMSRSEYKEACEYLFYLGAKINKSYGIGMYDDMGGTPLAQVMILSDSIIHNFKKRTNVQKVAYIVLSDGDGHALNNGYRPVQINTIKGKSVTLDKWARCSNYVNELAAHYKETYNIDSLHIFITPPHSVKIKSLANWAVGSRSKYLIEQVSKTLRKDRIAVVRCNRGFDARMVMIMGNDKFVEEAQPKSDKASDITKAFLKNNDAKKLKRAFAEKLCEIVA